MASPTSELGKRIPRRAKNVLDALIESRQMTVEGMEWLICATDPFHDDRVRCPGYPDLSTVNSVVQTFTATTSVTTGGAGVWDLHVPFLPFTPTIIGPHTGVGGATVPNGGLIQAAMGMDGSTGNRAAPGVPFLYPGFNTIVCQTTGDDWVVPSGTITNTSAISIPQKYASGHFRLIAAGVEIVNTTADLYKGGSISTYRAPSSPKAGLVQSGFSIAGVGYSVGMPMAFISLPPSTQAQAAIYTDTRTWAAEDGAYVIATMSDTENPYVTLSPGDVVLKQDLDSASLVKLYNLGQTQNIWTSADINITTGTNGTRGIANCSPLPFTSTGAILAGLNPNSTIQITVRYYLERIPALYEPDLLSMCQLPPAFDGTALEIYSRCLAQMPVGVPVAQNPLGEWFSSVVDTVMSVAPKIGSFLQGVGNALGGTRQNTNIAPVQSNATPQRKQTNRQKAQQKLNPKQGPIQGPKQQMPNTRKRKRNRKKKQQ